MSDLNQINYRGKPIVRDVDDSVAKAYYSHIYSASFDGNNKKHMCMQYGDWCWKQAREQPLTAVRFIISRLPK